MSNIATLRTDDDPSSSEPGAAATPVKGGGGGGADLSRLETRIRNLESAVSDMRLGISELRGVLDGVKHSQNITIAAVIGVGAILFSAIVYVAVAVNGLPAQLTDIADSIASAITATQNLKETPPIIINMPPPPPTGS